MLARRRQSCSMTVTAADDTESAPDVPTPTGRDRCSPPASSRSRPTHRSAGTSSGTAMAASRRRHAEHYRWRTPTSSPELEQSGSTAVEGGRTCAEAAAAVQGKTQFKYKRVKDSVRQPAKRGHLALASRKSDAHQEGIFD